MEIARRGNLVKVHKTVVFQSLSWSVAMQLVVMARPSMYLMKGQSPENLKGLFGNSSWLEKACPPPRSFVLPTPTTYMTDDAWDAAAEPLASGIRRKAVIKDYPNYWIILYLKGLSSARYFLEAQDLRCERKFRFVSTMLRKIF